MKSTMADLKKRGMATEDEISALFNSSLEEQIKSLNSDRSSTRSAAAINLLPVVNKAADELLIRLSVEKCLYTKIAICESLQKGNAETAEKMTEYLGAIGKNQYHKLPEKISAKKSFPLPRDIIARTLAKMDISVFPALLNVLRTKNIVKIREVLDAIGFMVFYHQELANDENVGSILTVMDTYGHDEVIVWKVILCLSAFPIPGSLEVLERFAKRNDILGNEAVRSINLKWRTI